MNKLTQGIIGVGLSAASFGVGGNIVEAGGNLPSNCTVYPVGEPVNKGAETALIDAGFGGITVDGKVSNGNEQYSVYQAQKTMKEIGVLAQDTRICGYAGETTRNAALLIMNADELASDAEAVETAPTNSAITLEDCSRYDEYTVDSIKAVQRALGILSDGKFGNQTCRALIEFQEERDLARYGRGALGNRTANALGVTLAKKAQTNNNEFNPVEDCPKPSSCDINIDLTSQRMRIINSLGVTLWDIPVQSGKLGKETRSGSGKLGPVEYGPGGNPERKSVDYPEATLVNPRGFGNKGQKIHGSYSFNANATNNPESGSAGCVRVSNPNSFVIAQMPTGTDVVVIGAKPGTEQRYF